MEVVDWFSGIFTAGFNKKGFNARGSSSHSEQALAFQAMKTVTATLGIPDSGLARFHVETWPDTGLIMET